MMISDDLSGELLGRFERMKSYRSNFDKVWHEIALRVLPRHDDFIIHRAAGQRREQYVYDSTAQLALPAFASAMESMLTPRTSKWHMLRPLSMDLVGHPEIEQYCEMVRDLLFRVRYASTANFASQMYEVYMSLGAFGTGALFIQDALAGGIRYQCIPLSELYVQEDGAGVVDTVFRSYKLTVRQAHKKWGDELPEDIKKWCDKEPDREFEFLHVVQPNDEVKRGKLNFEGMRFASFDVAVQGKKVLRRGGYRTMPYAVSRYVTSPREVYGRSPAWDVIADVKMLNEMEKTGIRVSQLQADPVTLTADVDSLSAFSMRPGSINAGYITEQGQVLAKQLAPEGNLQSSLEMRNQKRESINRAFLVTLFQILVETPQMTATEAMLRAQEKGALLAPTMGRQQSELLGPIIAREIDILTQAGVIPPPPDDLLKDGDTLKIVYDSPLTRAQRAEEGVGILRTLEALTPLANVDPSILKIVNAERTFRRLREINGAPVDMLNTPEEMAMLQQAAAMQQQAQQLIDAAPAMANSVKSLAQAQAEASKAPF